jgi:hypothetical protein
MPGLIYQYIQLALILINIFIFKDRYNYFKPDINLGLQSTILRYLVQANLKFINII